MTNIQKLKAILLQGLGELWESYIFIWVWLEESLLLAKHSDEESELL